LFHRGEAVRLVVDREAARGTEVSDVAAQDPHTQRVEGGEPYARGVGAQQLLDPLAHLAGRLVRERDGEDPLRRDAANTYEVGDPLGEHARLAAAGTREHEQRPLGGGDGFALLGVQAVEDRVGEQIFSVAEERAGVAEYAILDAGGSRRASERSAHRR